MCWIISLPVDEAVAELLKEKFRIDAPDLPNGVKSRLHLAISDASGDSAIFEYVDGRLSVHHGREYQVMTNSPFYDRQLAILDYWQQIGGLTMLPGTNRAPTASCVRRSISTPSSKAPIRMSPCRP